MEREPKPRGELEEKPFLEHLEDLRWVFLKIILAWVSASLIAFFFASRVFTVLQLPLLRMVRGLGGGEEGFVLRSLSPPEVFLMSIKLSLLVGFIVSLPVILYFCARFILPALKPIEKRYLLPVFAIGGALFFAGVLFAYWVVLPLSLRFFWKFTVRLGIEPEWTVHYYMSLAGKLMLAFGLVFEFPVVMLFLAKLGIVDYDILKRKRPYVIVGIFILAAFLTPPDIITQLLMAAPLLVLFEICLVLIKFFPRKEIA